MIRRILCPTVALVAAFAVVAHADPKDDVTAAIQKLAAATNYSWTTTQSFGQFQTTQAGKIDKTGGYTELSITRQDTTTDAFMKGDKVAVKQDDGSFKSGEELQADAQNGGGGGGGGGFGNPGMMIVRQVATFKAPADTLTTDVAGYQNIQKGDSTYTADMTEDQVKAAMQFGGRGRRGGGGGANGGGAAPTPPAVTNGKGTVTFTIGADGTISKVEQHLTGTMSFNGNDNDMDITRTTEFKDVGSTTVDVPDAAKAKLNG